MANNINARIYKKLIPAMKYAKKVNGQVVKKHVPLTQTKHDRNIDSYIVQYVVYSGDYKPIC